MYGFLKYVFYIFVYRNRADSKVFRYIFYAVSGIFEHVAY